MSIQKENENYYLLNNYYKNKIIETTPICYNSLDMFIVNNSIVNNSLDMPQCSEKNTWLTKMSLAVLGCLLYVAFRSQMLSDQVPVQLYLSSLVVSLYALNYFIFCCSLKCNFFNQ